MRINYLIPLCLGFLAVWDPTPETACDKPLREPVVPPLSAGLTAPLVVSQLPLQAERDKSRFVSQGCLRTGYGDGARLILVFPDCSTRVLTGDFASATDPALSFDAKRVLFAAKRKLTDCWNIYEITLETFKIRQITKDVGNCRSPCYQSTLYTIVSPQPWYQITFVSDGAGAVNECGSMPATDLYSCMPDGSAVRRLTFNLSSDMDPTIMWDGRLLYAGWQRSTLRHGMAGRVSLFGINIDGADHAAFCTEEGKRIKHMPCTTRGGLAVFVEADSVPWDGSGQLACVTLRRPLHSYRSITSPSDGLFHSPSPLPDGGVLVSRRPADGTGTHGVYRLDPSSGRFQVLFDDSRYHDIQAKLVVSRQEPDGRSSVVTEDDPHGQLYCLNVYTSDLPDPTWMPRGSLRRLRVLEGIPFSNKPHNTDNVAPHVPDGSPEAKAADVCSPGSAGGSVPRLAQRRFLGEIPVAEDGSFKIEIPANTPIELQILDSEGMALRSCSWIWAKNHEPRGCVGCHEDSERTPENDLVKAMSRPAISLCLPAERRRTVDFRRDVMPIIEAKCVPCHKRGKTQPHLDGGSRPTKEAEGTPSFNRAYASLLAAEKGMDDTSSVGTSTRRYVHPGRARTSPLIWHLSGRNTSRPWDGAWADRPFKPIPPGQTAPLTNDEKQTFIEWIDLGALWDGIP